VDQQVVQPDRRELVPERFERQRMVAGRELKLLERDARIGSRLHRWQ
jgi:hypothetical protein